jgi:hypothetical protein
MKSSEKHASLIEAFTRAFERYRREVFLKDLADDFTALRANRRAWDDEADARDAWDSTSGDGLAAP